MQFYHYIFASNPSKHPTKLRLGVFPDFWIFSLKFELLLRAAWQKSPISFLSLLKETKLNTVSSVPSSGSSKSNDLQFDSAKMFKISSSTPSKFFQSSIKSRSYHWFLVLQYAHSTSHYLLIEFYKYSSTWTTNFCKISEETSPNKIGDCINFLNAEEDSWGISSNNCVTTLTTPVSYPLRILNISVN